MVDEKREKTESWLSKRKDATTATKGAHRVRKGTFQAEQGAAADVDVNDPNFWQKVRRCGVLFS